jgi:hypothetical protein
LSSGDGDLLRARRLVIVVIHSLSAEGAKYNSLGQRPRVRGQLEIIER